MIVRIRQRAGAGQRHLVAMRRAPAAPRCGESPSDGLRLSVRPKPGYDGVTFGFDPGEHP